MISALDGRRDAPPTRPWLRLALLATGLSACAQAGPLPGSSDGNTLTFLHLMSEPHIPAQYLSPAKFLLYETLVWHDGAGNRTPRLALDWEHSDDYREWTYHLRDDVRWHDGAPFTSRDVKFTVELFAHPVVNYFFDLVEVRAPDDYTVVIRTENPRAPDAFTVIYPSHLLDELDPERLFEWEFWKRPVGNGPFRFVEGLEKRLWVLEAFDDHFEGRPPIDRIHLKLGGGNALVELLSGSVDVALLDRGLLPEIEADGRFDAYHQVEPGLSGLDAIWWNHRHPLTASPVVRRALTHAIDREQLQRSTGLPAFVPVVDVPYTARQLVGGELPAPVAFDPDEAIRLLEQEGWHDRDGDGVRERSDVDAALTALVPASTGAAYEFAAVYVQAALQRVGVGVAIRVLPDYPLDRIRAGDFDMTFSPFRPARSGWPEQIGYDNPRLGPLLNRASSGAGTPAEIDALVRSSWSDFSEDLPFTFLWQNVNTYVVNRRVHGLSSPLRADPYQWARELRIAPSPDR